MSNMRWFELLQQRIPPQRIAKKIVEEVSHSDDQQILTTLRGFLLSIADAIGLNYYVNLNEVTSQEFHWPQNAINYFTFRYNFTIFSQYGGLLERTCISMDEADLLEPLLHIVDVFFRFCESMDPSWEDKFWEPLSLISLSILKGLHKIRKVKSNTFPLLNNKCHKLFEFAQNGLEHQDSHEIIFKGLSLLLKQDYDYFLSFDEGVFSFFIKAMEDDTSTTRTHLFKHMKAALENSRVESGPRHRLIKFLSQPDFIKAYCFFSEQTSTNLILSLLRFLQALLSHLTVLECFSREQLHTIFRNALSSKPKVRELAIGFYLSYMRRSFPDKFIFRDIIDFYLSHAENLESLDGLIESLWDQFPYLTRLDPYARILGKTHWSLKSLGVTAQFAVRIFRRLYQEAENNDEYAQRLSRYLLQLPTILNGLEAKWQIVGILLQCYSVMEPDVAIIRIQNFRIAADTFVKYALDFLKNLDRDSAVERNMVHHMLRFMDAFNMQPEMEDFGRWVYTGYKDITSKESRPNLADVTVLQNILVLLAANTDTLLTLTEEHVFDLLSDLRTRLIETSYFQELSEEFCCSLAITTYSGCLNIFSVMYAQMTSDESNVESTVLLNQINPFHEYLLRTLGSDDQPKLSLKFAEAAIRALCDLYIIFNFKLERSTYHILVKSVEIHVFTAPPAGDVLRQRELQRKIMHCFNLLHKFVQIPSPITWKIVANIGVVPSFAQELTELLDILFEHNSEKFPRPKLFTYVIPVAIYNVFQRQTHLIKFHKTLNAIKKYIEDKLPDRTQRVMKLHVVLTIIEMIERALQVGDVVQQPNRMNLLSNMHSFLTNVYTNESSLILAQSRRLQRHSMTREELGTLSDFQEQFSS